MTPEGYAAIDCFNSHPEVHARNKFAHDIVSKFHRYGNLSPAQIKALEDSLQRDHERAVRDADPKSAAPEGRQTVTGEVLVLKEKESEYGVALKLMVKLANNSRVWVTAPKDRKVVKGDVLTLTATFERSETDRSFAFGSRPIYHDGRTSSPITPDAGAHAGATDPALTPPPFNAPKVAAPKAPKVDETPTRSVLAELLDNLEELEEAV